MTKKIVYITNRIEQFLSRIKKSISRPKKNSELLPEKMFGVIENDLLKLNNLDLSKKTKINEDVKKMILYYNQLTDQIESRRSRLIESSWQTLTILIAASGLLIAAKLAWYILYPALVIFGFQILFAILKLHEYQAQSSFKYPFTNSIFGNKWKWFYYANPHIKEINQNPYQTDQNNQKNLMPYLKGLHYFVVNYSEETLDSELSDNIQQLYLLQVHNYYKNKFFLRLNNYDLLANRVSFTLLFAYLGLLLGIWFYSFLW